MNKAFRSLLLFGCVLSTIPLLATDLPPGFVETRVINGNIYPGMVALSIANDGSIFVAQSGPAEGMKIYVLRPGAMAPTLAHTFPLHPTGERGISEIRVDPDHDTNARLWVHYTVLDAVPVHNRVSHFTVVNDLLTNEVVVLDLPPLDGFLHNGGCLVFDQAGRLFVGTGDDVLYSTTSQDPFDLRGKILHLNQDGTPAPDNISPSGTTAHPLVWATGLRNPFRCNMQPGLDNLFIGDVGWFTWEELNLGIPGANYGWANIEGPDPPGQPGYTYPIYSYNHNGAGAAIIGGDHAEAQDFADPMARDHDNPYEGDYFFVEWTRREMWRLELDQNNNVVNAELFATNLIGSINDLEFGPDGSLYTAGYSFDSVAKITFVGGVNRQPTAIALVAPKAGLAPLSVTLDGSTSTDPDDDPLTHLWDLGDSTFSSQAVVTKIYPQGVYEVELTVDDANGGMDTSGKLRLVSGNESPVPTITAPSVGAMYNAGQLVSYSGNATDPEEGTIPCSQVSWQVIFHHDDHTHPFIGPISGSCGGTASIPDIGEDSTNVWYEFRFVAQDTGVPIGAGAEVDAEQSILVYPNLTTMEVNTSPNPNLEVSIDTVPLTAPVVKDSVVGFQRTIGTPEFQTAIDGHTYRWLSWSPGGPREQTLPAPVIPTTYTANFGCNVIQPITLRASIGVMASPNRLLLEWTPANSGPCTAAPLEYEIWASNAVIPSQAPGNFPNDPPFTLVTTTLVESYLFPPDTTLEYFLVSVKGTDQLPGYTGHYGP